MSRVPLFAITELQAPAEEPVTLEEAKEFANVPDDGTDALVRRWITAARKLIESRTGRQLITAQFVGYAHAFADEIAIPRPPLQEVSEIAFVDTNGSWQVVNANGYQVSIGMEPALIWPAAGVTWPTPRAQKQAVRVTFTCGYGDRSKVHEGLKEAICRLVADWYLHREDTVEGGVAALPVPVGVDAIILEYETEPVVEEVDEPRIFKHYNRAKRLGGRGERRAGGYWGRRD